MSREKNDEALRRHGIDVEELDRRIATFKAVMTTDPRMSEYHAIRCDACHNMYYTPEPSGKCERCGSDNIVEMTHEEATRLFKETMKKFG